MEDHSDFIYEAQELFNDAEDALLSLKGAPNFEKCYLRLFRAFHSVKGAAGMHGLTELEKHVHQLESMLLKKKEKGEFSFEAEDYFLLGIDVARSILKGQSVAFDYSDPDQKAA